MGLAARRGMPRYRADVIRTEAARPVDVRGGAGAR
jgi:hypothetical protein